MAGSSPNPECEPVMVAYPHHGETVGVDGYDVPSSSMAGSSPRPVDAIANVIARRLTSHSVPPEGHSILFVDVGAGSGAYPSVTQALHSALGGRGLCVEPRSDAYAALLKNRPDCRAHRLGLGENDWPIGWFYYDPDEPDLSYLPSPLQQCFEESGLPQLPTRVLPLGKLLASEIQPSRAQVFEPPHSSDPAVPPPIGVQIRTTQLAYLHIGVAGRALPVIRGAMMPKLQGPPIDVEDSAFFLPTIVGLDTSYLLDAAEVAELLVGLLRRHRP
jgi:hypothetical protein